MPNEMPVYDLIHDCVKLIHFVKTNSYPKEGSKGFYKFIGLIDQIEQTIINHGVTPDVFKRPTNMAN